MQQSVVMIHQCVQMNHTPDVMVIDEIWRPAEVEAARTCKQRGVPGMVASAHGDLRKLVNKNRQLRGADSWRGRDDDGRGGRTRIRPIKQQGLSSKLKAVRAGEPTLFDAMVQLERGRLHCWRFVSDVCFWSHGRHPRGAAVPGPAADP